MRADSVAGGERGAAFSGSWKRGLFGVYLLFVGVWTLWTGAQMARERDPWIIGDWLINYSGGFVRRGLAGALVMLLHRATGVPLEWVVFAIEASVLVVFLAVVYRLTKGIRWSWLMAAVLLSPATLAFTVLAGHEAGLRKEILLFAALAIVVWVLMRGRWKDWQVSALLSIFLVGMALSHEALLVGAPYFLAAVAIQAGSLRRAAKICAVPLVLCVIACAAVITHHGDLATAEAICRSVGGTMGSSKPSAFEPAVGECGGSIAWLQLGAAQERALIAPAIVQWRLVPLFSKLALLIFGPLVALLYLMYRRDGMRWEVGVVVGCAVISLAGTGVLCYVGVDWGRWIHMQVVCLMLLAMMLDARAAAARVESVRGVARRRVWGRGLAAAALFLYATAWTMPGIGNFGESPGYLALVWPTYRNGLHELRVRAVGGIKKIV